MASQLDNLLALTPPDSWHESELEAGHYVFHQGQAVSAIFGVREGRVRLFRDLEDGSAVTLHVARAGNTFAEAALFADHYHCYAVAETASTVVVLSARRLLESLSADTALGYGLCRTLASQVRDMRAALSLRDIRGADERLLAWLRLRATRETMEIVIDRPWTRISEEMGLTKEAVYRSLSRLHRKGLITRELATVGAGERIHLREASASGCSQTRR